jgi:hypothetical protein
VDDKVLDDTHGCYFLCSEIKHDAC